MDLLLKIIFFAVGCLLILCGVVCKMLTNGSRYGWGYMIFCALGGMFIIGALGVSRPKD